MARIVLASYLVRFPVGGYQSWMLQWLLGFRRLGHDVFFVEKAGWPNACIDPGGSGFSNDCAIGVTAIEELFNRFDLSNRWCFVDFHGQHYGLSQTALSEVFRTADVFIDYMRFCEWPEESARVPCRIFLDGEPGLTQMELELRVDKTVHHPPFNYYYTVGRNVGTPASTAPTAGRSWRPTFNPVLPDLYPVQPPPPGAPFTTVMSWSAHGRLEFEGRVYGARELEFPKFFQLPHFVPAPLELALGMSPHTPVDELRQAGWRLRNGPESTLTFNRWRDYIGSSRGEFSVVKNAYVATNSGFFSDRSACYLASGRPVVMQETGFSAHLPCGRGLFAVRNVEEAAAAIEEICVNYDAHARAAREIASDYLDATRVAARMLREVGL
jgi:hypothetical protein